MYSSFVAASDFVKNDWMYTLSPLPKATSNRFALFSASNQRMNERNLGPRAAYVIPLPPSDTPTDGPPKIYDSTPPMDIGKGIFYR